MSIREEIIKQVGELTEDQLDEVADYLSFVRFRARTRPLVEFDERQLGALYAEFADEDRQLAEEGMADYTESLSREDQ
ncbi:MAG TPA: hypothetical protein VLZ81_15220 [Blastocatellia bacterium]|nr:hypothetical protein [Blastocatellia bacterium]